MCGERTSGHLTWDAGIREASRHLAWHEMIVGIIDLWLQRMRE